MDTYLPLPVPSATPPTTTTTLQVSHDSTDAWVTLQAFAAKEAELDDGATEVERALRRRATASKSALASLLSHIDAERLCVDARVAQNFATGSPEAAEELQKLQSGADPLPCRAQGVVEWLDVEWQKPRIVPGADGVVLPCKARV